MIRIVIDSNVVVAAIRSNVGWSHKLVFSAGVDPRWQACLSGPLLQEYTEQTYYFQQERFEARRGIRDHIDDTARISATFGKMSTITTELPDPVLKSMQELAGIEGTTVEKLAALAIAQAVGAWSSQCDVFAKRASRGDRQKFEAALSKVPAAPPHPGDE